MENADAFSSMSAPRAAQLAFEMVSAIQHRPSGEQLAGVAMLFLLMSKRMKADARDVLARTGARMEDALSYGSGEHIRAIKQYLREEM